uniref:TPT domain-containing protein n=1 Tax=Gongylonema pulchrum TaxID=637853 RepID=A0A183DQD1_9BILA
LAMDGTTGAIQDRVRQRYTANAHSMMYQMNAFSSLYLLVGLLLTGELLSFMAFVRIYPSVMLQMIILAIASAGGQYFIFKTVAEFGPLTCSIVTTTRKLFTMLGSVVLFGNTLTQRQSVATAIVFIGLLLDAIESKKKKKVKQQPCEHNRSGIEFQH